MEMDNLLVLFIVLNVLNVIIQTVKSLATVKCGKWGASIVNAIAYGLYTVVLVYTNCELDLWAKVIVVALANLIGVFVVKSIEEKMRKDKLWKVEATINEKDTDKLHNRLKDVDIPHNFVTNIGPYTIFNCFCATQKESAIVKEVLKEYNAKFFVTESKTL
jgi:uncharacterized protein YebE (UPF0316 family)